MMYNKICDRVFRRRYSTLFNWVGHHIFYYLLIVKNFLLFATLLLYYFTTLQGSSRNFTLPRVPKGSQDQFYLQNIQSAARGVL